MQCECCQSAASVHLTDVSNGVKKEVHLCDSCAKKQGVTIKSYLHKSHTQQPAFPSHLFEEAAEGAAAGPDSSCSSCGTTYRQFRSSGKFGCPSCYDSFGEKIEDLLEKIHSRGHHVGKIPARASDLIERERQLQSLRDDLDEAVREEAYEQAAQLRDRIHRLEGKEA